MPTYDFRCLTCGDYQERRVAIAARSSQRCHGCGELMTRLPSAPAVRVIGRADGKVIGGPDQLTADVLGYREKDLPDSLRAYPKFPGRGK